MTDVRFKLRVDGQLDPFYDWLTPASAAHLANQLREKGHVIDILPHEQENPS